MFRSCRDHDTTVGCCSRRAGTGRGSPSWDPGASGASGACAACSSASASYWAAEAAAGALAPHTSPPPLGVAAWAPAGCDRTRGSCVDENRVIK